MRLRRALIALAACYLTFFGLGSERPVISAEAPAEVRALWVRRTSLTTPSAIDALVHTAKERGFRALLLDRGVLGSQAAAVEADYRNALGAPALSNDRYDLWRL